MSVKQHQASVMDPATIPYEVTTAQNALTRHNITLQESSALKKKDREIFC